MNNKIFVYLSIYSIISFACNDHSKKICNIKLEVINNNFISRLDKINELINKKDINNYGDYQDSLRILRISINETALDEIRKNKLITVIDSLNKYIESQIEVRKQSFLKINSFTQLRIYKSFSEIYNSKRNGTSKVTELYGETSSSMPGGIFTGRATLDIYNNDFAQLTSCINVNGNEICLYFSGNIIKNNDDSYMYDSYHKTGYGDEKSPFKMKFKKDKFGKEYIEFDNKKGNVKVNIYMD